MAGVRHIHNAQPAVGEVDGIFFVAECAQVVGTAMLHKHAYIVQACLKIISRFLIRINPEYAAHFLNPFWRDVKSTLSWNFSDDLGP
jgi:hypothetical protein